MTLALRSASRSARALRKRRCGARQAGLTLIELVIAMLIAGLIMAATARMVSLAAEARQATSTQLEVDMQVQLAMQRISEAIRNTPQAALPTKASATTSGTWLSPVTYQLTSGNLTETDAAGTRTLAQGVTTFTITDGSTEFGRSVIIVTLIVASGDSTASSKSTVRMGGPR